MTNPATPEGPSGTPDFASAFASTPDTEVPQAQWDAVTPTLGSPANANRLGSLSVPSPDGVPGSMAEVWDATATGLDNPGSTGVAAVNPEAATPIPTTEVSTSVPELHSKSAVSPTPQQRLIHSRQHQATRRGFFPRRGESNF
jgi:hypothetical protein